MTNRQVVDREDFERAAADWLTAAINNVVEAKGRCTLALAGGSTPRPVYWALSQEPYATRVRWAKVWVYFGDERGVSPDHPDSNYGMAREALLRHVGIPQDQIFRMEAERPDRDTAAEQYARTLPERLDILILGVGPDGHTASLFPKSPALEERSRRVVPITAPKPPTSRLTITPPVVRSAREVVVLATGQDKAPVIARALKDELSPRDLPAQLARDGTWILDRAAAAGLV
jgi:6-phosphogluconolactonase